MPISDINSLMPIAQFVSFVVTAIWAVFKIKGTTEKLGISIEHLSLAISELKLYQKELSHEFMAAKEKTAFELSNIRERLSVIENKLNQ